MVLLYGVKSRMTDIPIVVAQLYSSEPPWGGHGFVTGDFQDKG